MKRYVRSLGAASLCGAVVALAACSSSGTSTGATGGSSSATATSGTSGGTNGGTITIDAGTPPLSADPGLDFTTQGNELESVIDTPLLTFKRGVEGPGGSTSSPGLATGLPTSSNGGKTYTFTLRPNLHYSDGSAIKASDVITALERDLK